MNQNMRKILEVGPTSNATQGQPAWIINALGQRCDYQCTANMDDYASVDEVILGPNDYILESGAIYQLNSYLRTYGAYDESFDITMQVYTKNGEVIITTGGPPEDYTLAKSLVEVLTQGVELKYICLPYSENPRDCGTQYLDLIGLLPLGTKPSPELARFIHKFNSYTGNI